MAPLPLRVFNTLTGDKETFTPLQPGKVGLYVCGVTPYDLCHIGHARTYVTFDVITRHLRAIGYDVNLVKNFTDVDDKIIKKGNAAGEPASAVAERFIAAYEEDMGALGILPPTSAPRVTTSIPDIIALVERLIARGAAYPVEGDVYFEVQKFPDYLKLSKRSVDEMQAGARVEVDQRKKNPADFALWKAAKPGEPAWDSPWGKGRPGWHIECSAMAFRHLGETFDMHGGGRDLVFPHHENEIAQSEAASHVPFAKVWMHAGMLNIDNEKMSKSLGNFFTIREVLKQVDPEAMRAFFLTAQYRGPVTFELKYFCPSCHVEMPRDEADALKHEACGATFSKDAAKEAMQFGSIDDADKRLAYVYKILQRIDDLGATVSDGPVFKPELTQGLWERFVDAMADDFNTAAAQSGLSSVLGFLNELLDKPQKPRDQMLRTLAVAARDIRRAGQVLGLYEEKPADYLARRRARLIKRRGIDVVAVERLIEERKAARAEKRFADADTLRGQLLRSGVVVQDGPGGAAVWEVVES